MRIEVTRRFRDMDALTDPARTSEDDPVHEVGSTITVTKERGDDLVARGFAVEVATASTPTKRAAPNVRKPAAKKPTAAIPLAEPPATLNPAPALAAAGN